MPKAVKASSCVLQHKNLYNSLGPHGH